MKVCNNEVGSDHVDWLMTCIDRAPALSIYNRFDYMPIQRRVAFALLASAGRVSHGPIETRIIYIGAVVLFMGISVANLVNENGCDELGS